jgi:hypothetical protein
VSLFKARQELWNVRKTWKKEQGHKQDKPKVGINWIDGVVFGLTIALDIVDKYRRGK